MDADSAFFRSHVLDAHDTHVGSFFPLQVQLTNLHCASRRKFIPSLTPWQQTTIYFHKPPSWFKGAGMARWNLGMCWRNVEIMFFLYDKCQTVPHTKNWLCKAIHFNWFVIEFDNECRGCFFYYLLTHHRHRHHHHHFLLPAIPGFQSRHFQTQTKLFLFLGLFA